MTVAKLIISLIHLSLVAGCVSEPFSGASTRSESFVALSQADCIRSAITSIAGVVFVGEEAWADDYSHNSWGKKIEKNSKRYSYRLSGFEGQGQIRITELSGNKNEYLNSFGRSLRANFYSSEQLEVVSNAVDQLNEAVKSLCKIDFEMPPAKKYRR